MTSVVASLGTDHHPFPRLLDWLASAAAADDTLRMFAQRGLTGAPDTSRSSIESVDFLSADELSERFRAADVVVCHGGPGTIAAARRSGHLPVVVPRDPTLGEHVDDHQQRYCEQLAGAGRIVIARTADALTELLSNPPQRLAATDDDSDDASATEAAHAFGRLVDELVAGRSPRRTWRQRVLLRRTP